LWSCKANALKGALLFRPWPYLVTTEMKFDQTEMNELEVPRVVQTRAGKPQFIPKFHRLVPGSQRAFLRERSQSLTGGTAVPADSHVHVADGNQVQAETY
jgi:hypothetical protein